jgi:hypothetical protein
VAAGGIFDGRGLAAALCYGGIKNSSSLFSFTHAFFHDCQLKQFGLEQDLFVQKKQLLLPVINKRLSMQVNRFYFLSCAFSNCSISRIR